MSAQEFVGLLEKLIDLKLQQQAELQMKVAPEMNHFLQEKRESDRQKMVQIRKQLVTALEGPYAPR
jgi:hypothetical protein